jgi:translation initiation factor 3 subunit F
MATYALNLSDVPLPVVKLHPTVVLSILNHYIRRDDRQTRVIGTLLGVRTEGNVEISECFGVPHQEKSSEGYVAINMDYHKSMFACHSRINRREVICGWYTTTTPDGAFIIDNSSLINEFYEGECQAPIHLVVDSTLSGGTMGIRAFVSNPMIVGTSALANMFEEIKVEIVTTDAETSILYALLNFQAKQRPQGSVGATLPATGTNHTFQNGKHIYIYIHICEETANIP